jgi:hypothetical protein
MDPRVYEVTEANGHWKVLYSMGGMPFSSRRVAIKSAADAAQWDRRRGIDVRVRVQEADGKWSDLQLT